MKITESLVSIILPFYNASTTLPACIESLLAQTHKEIEVILVDDCSKDDSFKIASILKKCDSRIRLYRNKKRYGPAVCFNRGIRFAKGQFIALMNPTDIAATNKIKKQVAFLQKNEKVVAVGTQCTIVKSGNSKERSTFPTEHTTIYPTLLHGISMRFETALINRHLLPKDILKFTTNAYPFIFSSLFLKILQYGKLSNLNQYLYWHHEAGVTNYQQPGTKNKVISYVSLFIKSFAEHDYRPSIRAFLEPFTTPVRTRLR